MKCNTVPGMTLAVVKGNETWIKGFGMADLDTDRRVNEGTLFVIGSLTKAFTSALLSVLLSNNKKGISWTSKLSDILGDDFQFIDPTRTSQTTLRDILSHKTGLANTLGALCGYPSGLTRKDMTRRLKFLPEIQPFRDTFVYNNMMYMLAGHVAEVLGGDTWENLVKTRLFQPIGMHNTTVLTNPSQISRGNTAKPYMKKEEKLVNGTERLYQIFPEEPAGAIMSNGADMAKWMKFILNKGRTETNLSLVEEKLFKECFKTMNHLDPQLYDFQIKKPTFPVEDVRIGYGYGWFTSIYQGYTKFQHGGSLMTYQSLIWLFPDQNIGIFGSVNGPATSVESDRALNSVFYYLSDILLSETVWMNETLACTFPKPFSSPLKRSASIDSDLINPVIPILDKYVGRYGNVLMPDMEITKNGDILMFRCNRMAGILHPTHVENKFKSEVIEPWEIVLASRVGSNQTELTNVVFKMDGQKAISLEWQLGYSLTFIRNKNFFDGNETSLGGEFRFGWQVFVFILCFKKVLI
ncbi:hypothetical protein CHS0354_006676 [Potamilus streckersoni]|uniref:Beta-lactamase-related domain-containing protein n=1 Tax=Potamilus streckersoni TaxID=2493646 RepID=A0AAE0SWS1_9BIVA|nr:hypothetical protein CHS0354_006676 [Potamilus streckersoni]